jgi:hypothetical protein
MVKIVIMPQSRKFSRPPKDGSQHQQNDRFSSAMNGVKLVEIRAEIAINRMKLGSSRSSVQI